MNIELKSNHLIYRWSQRILDSLESSDVSLITTDIGRLMIRKQQSPQFCHETKLKQIHKTLNDKLN